MNNQKIFTVQELPFKKPQKKNLFIDSLLRKKIFVIIVLILFAIFIILLAVSLTLIFVLNTNLTCAKNSKKSGSMCVCNDGFSGDGLNYCDGIKKYDNYSIIYDTGFFVSIAFNSQYNFNT